MAALADLCSGIIVYRVMTTVAPSTVRVKRLRERRSQGVTMVAPVEVGEGGIDLLVSNGLLDKAMKNDRQAVGKPASWPLNHEPATDDRETGS
jgi:hypothetical protein